MTNEQKRQILEYMGYWFHITTNPSTWSVVVTPDDWRLILDKSSDIFDSNYEEMQLSQLIDIAWQHLEAQEMKHRLEYIVLHSDNTLSDIHAIYHIHGELKIKFGGLDYPQAMKMFYDD